MTNPQDDSFFKISFVLIISIPLVAGVLAIISVIYQFEWYFLNVQGLVMDIVGVILVSLHILKSVKKKFENTDLEYVWTKIGTIIIIIGFVLQMFATIFTNAK